MRFIAGLLAALVVSACSEPAPSYDDIARSYNMPLSIGPVCGNPDIYGIEMEDIGNGAGRGCGVDDPVKIFMVSGVALQNQPSVNCETAQALNSWVSEAAQPVVEEDIGTRIESLKVIADYSCRTRNNQKGARMSEHSRGNALDIAALKLADGTVLSVLNDWRSEAHAGLMKALHASACGPFGTVLGPKSDRHHQDHFHFDVASYRSGPYCR